VKLAEELEFAIGPRPPGSTLQGWLYSELRQAILSGRLASGQRLPSTRDFARQHKMSRGTVLAVYEQLIAEGYLVGTTGSGTTVSSKLPAKPAPAQSAPAGATPPRLSRQGSMLAASPFSLRESGPVVPFRPNQPDVAAFPLTTWRRLATRYSRTRLVHEMGNADAAGYAPLRRAIADHLHYSQRIACDAEQVIIVSSAQQALDLCARLLLDPGDTVLLEDPCYPGAPRIFAQAGARVTGVPVDLYGLRTDPPLPVAPGIRLAYVTAAHQAPLGGTLPLERRLALLDWADACDAVIIEDDYDGEFRFDGTPLPALKSLDRSGRVLYMGAFSKLLFPSLRLAYLVVPEGWTDAFASAISLTCRHAPVFQQAVLSAFIDGGHFARHLRQMRLLYGGRAQEFQRACQQHCGGLLELLPISTGLDATALLPEGTDDRAVAAALAQQGIMARPVSFYGVQHPAPPGLVLGFSCFDGQAIRQGAARMGEVLERLRAMPPGGSGSTA
jgi:GntR family transcriptional regulator / MocR family aminotransferase